MAKYHLVRKIVGALLVLIGLISLITPLTPGAWLIIVGLQLLGFKILFLDKIIKWFKKQE